jgi:hypothetical protein
MSGSRIRAVIKASVEEAIRCGEGDRWLVMNGKACLVG